jgi:prevent-host-death family protein
MVIYGGHMRTPSVSIAEGKKGFSRLIKEAETKKSEIIVTKRGKPVAVILPFNEFLRAKRINGFNKIMEARKALAKPGLSAEKVYRESRSELEKRS